jgi:probable HAF family extracellular repeat protein
MTKFKLALALAVGTASGVASAQTLTGLGTLPGGLNSYAYALSADGNVVAGYSPTSTGDQAFRWTSGTGMVALGTLSGGSSSYAFGLSADGSASAGYGDSSSGIRAFRWTSGGLTSLGVLTGGSASFGNGISGNGAVVVGYSNSPAGPRAFRWTSAGGLENLGALPGASTQSNALDANTDGTVVVGYSGPGGGFHAFRWVSGTGMQDLGSIPNYSTSYANAVTPDGSVVVGRCFELASGSGPVFRWTEAGGMQDLGALPGGLTAFAYDVSSDGNTIVGGSSSSAGFHAFLWTQPLGMVDLNEYLPAHGFDLTGWSLTEVWGISGDGQTLAGNGTHNGHDEAWIARFGSGCYANCDHSTATPILNVQDFSCFLTKFASGDPYANCDNSTAVPVLNVQDFSCFLTKFASGCTR